MRQIGFITSHKENEKRRALLPQDIIAIKHKDRLYFEKGYGHVLGIDDESYEKVGCHISSREEILKKVVICDPKVGDADYLNNLNHQVVFGWIHAVQNRDITDILVNNKLTAFAWEEMFEGGRNSFWKNNEIAGEAAIMHAFQLHGIMPYHTKVALLGKGNIARGALKILTLLGADVMVYDRKSEELFKQELPQFDVVVNGIMWDTKRKDHIIYEKDLFRMKKNSLIIDISCDRHGGIETSEPTTIDNPTYEKHGIIHYVVDHTPALFYKNTSLCLSKEVAKYIDDLVEDNLCDVLKNSMIIKEGQILDQAIIDFQKR